jgi:hypothetical protein
MSAFYKSGSAVGKTGEKDPACAAADKATREGIERIEVLDDRSAGKNKKEQRSLEERKAQFMAPEGAFKEKVVVVAGAGGIVGTALVGKARLLSSLDVGSDASLVRFCARAVPSTHPSRVRRPRRSSSRTSPPSRLSGSLLWSETTPSPRARSTWR